MLPCVSLANSCQLARRGILRVNRKLIVDLGPPGHGGAGGEQGDCLLRAQRLVPVQVMLLKQRSEELQASSHIECVL